MVFTDIRLQNYRSYKDSSFELDGGVTIVVGPNAAGKSNLIEAVLLVANNNAYRGKNNIVNHASDWSRVDIHTDKNESRTLKIKTEKGKEKPNTEFVIGGKVYRRLPEALKQPAVLFEPNNLFLMHGEPQARREYMDMMCSAMNDEYGIVLARYKRTLAQRNALLKKPRLDESQLFVWNVRLSELADIIVKQRVKTLEMINTKLSQTYSTISGKKTTLNIVYKSPLRANNYSANLLKNLEASLELDRIRGFTGSGPHREDFAITLNGNPISTTASRGETRTLLLALKTIELEVLEEKTSVRPLLLLDDVFSELDGARRKALTKFLKRYQTIITTTDADVILKNFSQNCQIIPLS